MAHLIDEQRQKESGRRLFLAGGLAACLVAAPALADDKLDPGGLTFRDFATNDNGASFSRGDPMIARRSQPGVVARSCSVDGANGLARIQFRCIRVELALPLGWQATEDWERGVAFSSDKRYRRPRLAGRFRLRGRQGRRALRRDQEPAPIQARRPAVQAQARKLGDGTFLIVYDNVPSARRRRAEGGVRPGDPEAGRSQGGHPDDPGCAGERCSPRTEADGALKAKYAD